MAEESPPTAATATAAASSPPQSKTYELSASSIYYAKPTATLLFNSTCARSAPPQAYILRDVSLTARPGELLAVVGPSGAGKSTLLDILAARTAPSRGLLLLNSSPLRPSAFRRLSAHVPQHDSSLPLLTVSETFAFVARLLLLPNSPSLVSALLSDLRLSHLAHTRLSAALSGGERRRVSIGLALLHDPAVLLFDEPTSGLDSSSALNIVQILHSIAANRHRTIILSIHQPSYKILSTIDSILLLSKGSVLHHGTLNSLEQFLLSAGFTVPAQLNPLEYAMEILDQLPHPTTTTATTIESSIVCPPPSNLTNRIRIRYTSSQLNEIWNLYLRFCKIIYRSRQLLLTNTLEALIVGFLLGTIYINVGYDKQGIQKRLGFFAFTLTFLLSSTTETLPIFVNERPILLREVSCGLYRLSSHVTANALVFVPYLLAVAVLYSAAVYFLVGLCAKIGAFLWFVAVVWAVLLAANSFVLFVSAVAPDYIAGTSAVTAALAGFFLFSGYFISKESMPRYWVGLHYLSPYKYGLDSMLATEYGCEAGRCFDVGCAVKGRDVMESRGIRVGERWRNLGVLLWFFVLYRMMYWVVLTRRASRSK